MIRSETCKTVIITTIIITVGGGAALAAARFGERERSWGGGSGGSSFPVRREVLEVAAHVATSEGFNYEMPADMFGDPAITPAPATVDEMRVLVGHPAAAVRAHAFYGLFQAGERPIDELFDHLDDRSPLEARRNCTGFNATVADLFIIIAWDHLDEVERDAVLTHLLRRGEGLQQRDWALVRLELPDRFYGDVRRLAEARVEEAFVALARYQRPEDVELILEAYERERARPVDRWNSAFFDMHMAMELFPDERYLPALTAHQRSFATAGALIQSVSSRFYGAVAAIGPAAAPLLETAFEAKARRPHHLKELSRALERHLPEELEPLGLRLVEEGAASGKLLALLIARYPDELGERAHELLTDRRHGDLPGRVLHPVVKLVVAEEPSERRSQTLRTYVRLSNESNGEVAAWVALHERDRELIPSLVQSVEMSYRRSAACSAARALLAWNEPELDAALEAAVEKRERRLASMAASYPDDRGVVLMRESCAELQRLLREKPRSFEMR